MFKLQFILIGVLVLFFNCKGISVLEIKKGEHLHKAKDSSVEFFFQNRMKNSIKKVIGRIWEIIYSDPNFIYFGYTKGSSWDDLYVDELYKVNRKELETQFPGYERITGIEVNRTVHQSVPFQTMHSSTLIQDFQKKFSLGPEAMIVDLIWTYSADGAPEKKKKFQIQLSKVDAKILSYIEIPIP